MTNTEQNRLARIVKRFLDVIWYVLIFTAIVWPIAVMVIGLSMPSDPAQRHADIDTFLGFKVYSDVSTELSAESGNAADLLIRGQGMVHLNNTPSLMAWYLSGAITEIMGFIFLFGLLHMRRLFASVIKGEPFAQENAGRIKTIGYVFIGWHVIYPLLQYFGGRLMLNDIGFNVQGILLHPAFELNIAGIFAGFAIIVLSGILREATRIHHEQSLTV
jgi:hypothetical protein